MNVDTLLDSALYNVSGIVLQVNSKTRTIQTNNLLLGVESDKKSERIYFSCNKIVGNNIDLSTLRLYINYQDAKGNKNAYLVEDVTDNGDDTIMFSWELDSDVTLYKGRVSFIVCAKKSLGDGTLTNEWNTTPAFGNVLEGLEVEQEIVEQNIDILEQILNRIEALEESGGVSDYNDLENKPITKLTGTTESPIILKDLENGVYILDGKVTPYSGGSTYTYSNSIAIVQKTSSYTYVQMTYSQTNNIHYYKINNTSNVVERTTTTIDDLEKKPTIAKNTSNTTVTTQLADNLFYQCQNEMVKLTLRFPNTIEDDYNSRITFKSGATPTTLVCDYDVIWYGEDVSNSEFTPKANKSYYIEFYKNVDGVNAYVRFNEIDQQDVITSFNDLTDKPFEVLGLIDVDVIASQSLEFTSDPMFGTNGVNSYLPFISNLSNMFVLEKGKEYKVMWDNTLYTCTCEEYSFNGLPSLALGNVNMIGIQGESSEPFVIAYVKDFPEVPNYCGILTLDTSSSHTVRLYTVEENIKYLDSKFIKDMYYSEDGEEVAVLESAEYQFVADSGVYATELPTTITLDVNDKYKVTFDESEYYCIPQDLSSMVGMGAIALGNLSINGDGLANTGEPFMIIYANMDGQIMAMCGTLDTSPSHTIGISQVVEVVHQIPQKYVNSYSKEEIDSMFGIYVDEVNALLGGE